MSKHTPGPWTIEKTKTRSFWVQKEDPNDSIAYSITLIVGHENAAADAHLIAAAPELKLACEGALAALLLAPHVDKDQAIDYLRAVLAKAEGGGE